MDGSGAGRRSARGREPARPAALAHSGGRGSREEVEHVAQAAAGSRRLGAELLGRRAGAVDPQRRIAVPGRADRVPAVAGDEQDLARRQAQRLRPERIGGGVGLVAAHRIDAEHRVEQLGQPRALDRHREHRRVTVGQHAGTHAARAQRLQHLAVLGEGAQVVVLVEQAVEVGRGRLQALQPQRVVQRRARQLPERPVEAAVAAAHRHQPRVLDLLVAPAAGDALAVAGVELLGEQRDAVDIEQRAVGVEQHRLRNGQCAGRALVHGVTVLAIGIAITRANGVGSLRQMRIIAAWTASSRSSPSSPSRPAAA